MVSHLFDYCYAICQDNIENLTKFCFILPFSHNVDAKNYSYTAIVPQFLAIGFSLLTVFQYNLFTILYENESFLPKYFV